MLPGQETLLASWAALADVSAGARIVRSAESAAAVFPAWAPLNNAIMSGPVDDPAVARLRAVYDAAGVAGWALWVASRTTELDAPDELAAIDGFDRDTTTLVMRADLGAGLRTHDGVVRVSLAAAVRAGDEPVPAAEFGEPEELPGFAAWAMVLDSVAVASAWSFRHGTDCGIYAVGTVPAWRRRGLASALTRHVLAVAHRDGARTASLQSTAMAQGLYRSLGFVAVGRYAEWIARQPCQVGDDVSG